MSKIVFDVETIGVDFDSLDQMSKEVLLKNTDTEEEKQLVRNSLGLSPLTGEIIAIGMLDCEQDEGVVFYRDKNGKGKNFDEANIKYVSCTEKEILENFWKKIKKYDQFITFNGRGFDCPFVMIRSGILKIKPTKDLMPYRYDTRVHVDLYDQLTFYGAIRRGFSLHMLTQAFGIKSPKEQGIDGAQIGDLFQQQKSADIARYCMRDVKATKELYGYWEKYIKAQRK